MRKRRMRSKFLNGIKNCSLSRCKGWKIIPTEGRIIANGNSSELYKRTPEIPAKLVPPEWSKLVGAYGCDYNVLCIMDRNNQLTALLEMDYARSPKYLPTFGHFLQTVPMTT